MPPSTAPPLFAAKGGKSWPTGTIATAFLLLPELGLRLTVWVGAALNALLFAAAALLARGALPAAAEATARGEALRVRAALVLAVAFL